MELLAASIARIREYTDRCDELRRATLFSYDVLLGDQTGSTDVVVFGINQAEYDCDRELRRRSERILEDTSEGSFRDTENELAKCSKSKAKIWYAKIEQYIDTRNAVLGELFFWSSSDVRHLKFLYGSNNLEDHFEFCKKRNLELISHYKPRAVVVLGTSKLVAISARYGLVDSDKPPVINGERKIVVHKRLGTIPWLIVLHPSARPRNSDKMLIHKAIKDALATPPSVSAIS